MSEWRRTLWHSVAVCLLLAGGFQLAGFASNRWGFARNDEVDKVALEYVWTYRRLDGVHPPEAGTRFCIVTDPENAGAKRLIVAAEAILHPKNIGSLLVGRVSNTDAAVLTQSSAPARDISFHRLDLDGDGIDEVLLMGRGGAGGTSLLSVYQIGDTGVKRIFTGASRFGFHLFDPDGTGKYRIASPAFKSIVDESSELTEEEFVIYDLSEGEFRESLRLPSNAFSQLIEHFSKVRGIPIPSASHCAIMQVYENRR